MLDTKCIDTALPEVKETKWYLVKGKASKMACTCLNFLLLLLLCLDPQENGTSTKEITNFSTSWENLMLEVGQHGSAPAICSYSLLF